MKEEASHVGGKSEVDSREQSRQGSLPSAEQISNLLSAMTKVATFAPVRVQQLSSLFMAESQQSLVAIKIQIYLKCALAILLLIFYFSFCLGAGSVVYLYSQSMIFGLAAFAGLQLITIAACVGGILYAKQHASLNETKHASVKIYDEILKELQKKSQSD